MGRPRPHPRPAAATQGHGAVVAWIVVFSLAGLVALAIMADVLLRSTPTIGRSRATGESSLALLAAALGGVVAFGYGLRTRGTQRLVENTPTSAVRSLPLGFVEVVGTAEPDGEALVSPWSNRACVYYEFRLQELRGDRNKRRWVTIAEERSSEPFYLRDATDRVLIVPMGATIRVRREQIFSNAWPHELPDDIQRALQRLHMPTASWLGPRRLRCRERVIAPGESLYVLGTAQENPAVRQNAADASRVYIGSAPGDRPFLIVDQTEHAFLSRLRWIARTCVYGGPVVTAVALALWLRAVR